MSAVLRHSNPLVLSPVSSTPTGSSTSSGNRRFPVKVPNCELAHPATSLRKLNALQAYKTRYRGSHKGCTHAQLAQNQPAVVHIKLIAKCEQSITKPITTHTVAPGVHQATGNVRALGRGRRTGAGGAVPGGAGLGVHRPPGAAGGPQGRHGPVRPRPGDTPLLRLPGQRGQGPHRQPPRPPPGPKANLQQPACPDLGSRPGAALPGWPRAWLTAPAGGGPWGCAGAEEAEGGRGGAAMAAVAEWWGGVVGRSCRGGSCGAPLPVLLLL